MPSNLGAGWIYVTGVTTFVAGLVVGLACVTTVVESRADKVAAEVIPTYDRRIDDMERHVNSIRGLDFCPSCAEKVADAWGD